MQRVERLMILLWPGLAEIGRAVRWAGLAGILGYLVAIVPASRDAWAALVPHAAECAVITVILLVIAGTTRRFDSRTVARVVGTHRDLPGARSPVGWAYALIAALVATAFAANLATTHEPKAAGFAGLMTLVAGSAGCALFAASAALTTRAAQPKAPLEARPDPKFFFADHPITKRSEDILGRWPVARLLVKTITEMPDASPGFISLEGDWGSGKSSVVAMAKRLLCRCGFVAEEFSGFHFATTDRLADSLAATIEAALNERYATLDAGSDFASYYAALRPVLSKAVPFGLPEFPETRGAAKDRLEEKLASSRMRRPIVVFLEDLDRLRGKDLLKLLAAVQLIGAVRGFTFVLVLDRARCAKQLKGIVPDPREYLRKAIHVAIPLPEPPQDILHRQLNSMLDRVAETRGFTITPPARLELQIEDWIALFPSLRHLKQLVNSYSLTMAELAGEIDSFDALLATALDQAEPNLLPMIYEHPYAWLSDVGLSLKKMMEVARHHEESKGRVREQFVGDLKLAQGRWELLKPFVTALFPGDRSYGEDRGGQHLASLEYFERYRERAVRSQFVKDRVIYGLVNAVNLATSDEEAEAVATKQLQMARRRSEVLDKLSLRPTQFEPGVRLGVIVACAKLSKDLKDDRGPLGESEFNRAAALVVALILQGEDLAWKHEAIVQAITCSSRPGFACWVAARLKFEADRSPDPTADLIDPGELADVLACFVRSRLEGGYRPLQIEPTDALPIYRALPPQEAARFVVDLGDLGNLLSWVRAQTIYGRIERLDWSLLQPFDLEVLRAGVPGDREPTTLEAELLAGPTPRPEVPEPAQEKPDDWDEPAADLGASTESGAVRETTEDRYRPETSSE